jgi:Smg protein
MDVEEVIWVVLLVLFSQPGQEQAYARLDGLDFDDVESASH